MNKNESTANVCLCGAPIGADQTDCGDHGWTNDRPIKIRSTRAVVTEWYMREYGSWEDWQRSKELGNTAKMFPGETMHVVEILDRWKTQIEIRDVTELKCLLKSADWCGCGGYWDEGIATAEAIDRIADKARKAAEELGWDF